MKTLNKNTLRFTAMWVVIPLCLALTCLSRPSSAQILHGPANGTTVCPPGLDRCYSITQLPVGPGPHAGVNPNDYGMCGLLHLSGPFDNYTVVEIFVVDGYYAVSRSWQAGSGVPTADWTCVRFTDFTGLPSISELSTFDAATVTASNGSKATKGVGGFADACVWAGVAGELTSKSQSATSTFAQFQSVNTLESVESGVGAQLFVDSWCSGFKGFSWGNYLNSILTPAHGDTLGTVVPVGATTAQSWCYMDGVGTTAGGSFTSAGLDIALGDYFYDVGSESKLRFNCLRLAQ